MPGVPEEPFLFRSDGMGRRDGIWIANEDGCTEADIRKFMRLTRQNRTPLRLHAETRGERTRRKRAEAEHRRQREERG